MIADGTETLYQQVVLDRSRSPRHRGDLHPAHATALGDNPMCGDQVRVAIHYAPGGMIDACAFQGRGCAISLAAADLMAEIAAGQTPETLRAWSMQFDMALRAREAPAIDPALETLRPLLGVREYPSRIKCATLPWRALMAALDTEAGADE